ncbi:DNA methyltransferase [Sulfolobus virus STSV1]|uniref:DNA methyltransferase n=1 Tax=Sulfolobus virus STSV1 TaxID=285013 RepID=UPI000042B0FA|nr:DNA methyltransferase [Sulfolobus virus STSV1]CAH04195.1 Adenine-specific DNA methylase [Sulfolobus virus STSV1]
MPPIWEMVFWWTRKPLIGARAIIAASLLPESVDKSKFLRLIRLDSNESVIYHKYNPADIPSLKKYFKNAKLLDPFAGFCSIPLEAMRLGVGEVVASDLLPTAYIFLKAILEIPKWARDNDLHETLIKDVEKWGNWILDELRKDQELQELYDDDAEGYIGTWEIRCPHCSNYTPLIGSWWLARKPNGKRNKKENGGFKRLAWMVPNIVDNKVDIDVIDLNKELSRDKINAKVDAEQGIVEVYEEVNGVPQLEKTYHVQQPNVDIKRNTSKCLVCNTTIKGGRQFYVKDAVRDWNENLEKYLAGEISKEQLLNSKVRPRIIVKIKNGIIFEKVEDQEKLWKALEMLKQMWGDPDIPTELAQNYESRHMPISFGVDKFFKFFNPRQLLTAVKFVKLLREVGKRVEEEKLKVWNKDKARKYAEAIVTYLAMLLAKFVNYSSIGTAWDATTVKSFESFSMRGLRIMWNWVDITPYSKLSGSFIKSLRSVLRGLQYLIDAISDSPTRVRVLLDDATKLNKITENFDLIVTDPPYWDDVPYTELSDLYYVWLKRALSDVKEVNGVLKRVPKFYPEAFFDNAGNEIETQWKKFAIREISRYRGRVKYFYKNVDASEHFKRLLAEAFKTIADRLKENGILVTYYAHPTPEAWNALLEAGWSKAGLRITKTHLFVTESRTRLTAQDKITVNTSLVIVWRKRKTMKKRLKI